MANIDRDPLHRSPEQFAEKKYSDYSLKPIVIDAETAHKDGIISYNEEGIVSFRHPDLEKHGKETEVNIALNRQYPLVAVAFDDLQLKLSNSVLGLFSLVMSYKCSHLAYIKYMRWF